jgi:Fic family protein
MYKPNYKITPIITKEIGAIAAAREAILSSPFLPKIENRLKKDALINRSHHSTSIEGNRLSREQVALIVSGKKLPARSKDKKEVMNYISTLKFIDKYGRNIKRMTPSTILKIHNLITKGVLPTAQCGAFRSKMVYVVDSFGKTVFTPPKAEVAPQLVKDLCDWLNSKEAKDLYSILTAGIAHYELVRIHPFIDGNGRTARALATLILYNLGFDIRDFFSLDDYYNEDRASYYAALQSVNPKTIDITQWLEYFTEGVAVQIGEIKEKVQALSRDRLLIKELGQIWLNERQWKFVEYLNEAKQASSKDYISLFKAGGISERTVRLDIEFLVKNKVIKRSGRGRAIHYHLNP